MTPIQPPAPEISSSSTATSGFRWSEADAYFFDIDGTLLKSRDRVHYLALNIAMQTVYGMDTTIDGVPYHGMTDLGILRAALERVGISGDEFASKLPAALKVVRDYVDQQAATLNPHVCKSIPEVLDLLNVQREELFQAREVERLIVQLHAFIHGTICYHYTVRPRPFLAGLFRAQGRIIRIINRS